MAECVKVRKWKSVVHIICRCLVSRPRQVPTYCWSVLSHSTMQRRRGYAVTRGDDVGQWLPAVTAVVVDDIIAVSIRQTDEVAADMTITTVGYTRRRSGDGNIKTACTRCPPGYDGIIIICTWLSYRVAHVYT